MLGPKEPYHEGFLNWAKAVEARTKGGLKIEVFHSAQLGKEEDILEQIRQGANIGQNTDSARMGNYVPGIAVMNGPYFAESLEDVAKLRKAPTVIKWQEELATKFGFKVVCFNWVQGYRHFFTNKPVRKPEDLKGLRIRTPPAPIWQESIRALGATPVAMAFGEMYPGLQQKAIDGVELVYNNIPGGKFYEVLKFANETRHIMLINFEVVSAKWFDGLPKDYQIAWSRNATRPARRPSKQIFKLEAEVEQQLQGPRHDHREGRRSRGVSQGRRQGLRGLKFRGEGPGAQGDREEIVAEKLYARVIAAEAWIAAAFLVSDGRADLPGRRVEGAGLSAQLEHRLRDRVLRLGLLPVRRHRLAQEQPDGDRARDQPPAGAAADGLQDDQLLHHRRLSALCDDLRHLARVDQSRAELSRHPRDQLLLGHDEHAGRGGAAAGHHVSQGARRVCAGRGTRTTAST